MHADPALLAQRKKTAPAARKPSTSNAICPAAAPFVALAEAEVAVFDALAVGNEKPVPVTLPLPLEVAVADEVVDFATIKVVVPYSDAALQNCV